MSYSPWRQNEEIRSAAVRFRVFFSFFFFIVPSAGFALEPQDELNVSRFIIHDSPLELRGEVRPHQFVSAVGRASAWLGNETGEAEIWIHPIKLVDDFHLDFRIPDYMEPVRGADVARTVLVRPELLTITYTHATFTVRQHILAPLDEPAILVLLDVDTFRTLEIVVSFKTVFQYGWPAAFGGQYTFWSEDDRAFILSESLRERNAVIGSPWAGRASSHPAHALPNAPNQFVLAVDPERIESELVPIGLAAANAPREDVLVTYRRIIGSAERLYQERRDYVVNLLEETTSIDTPDDELDIAFDWAKINLDEAFVCNPDLGCGLVAGWGPSGESTRPGFGWFFGGDAAVNSLAMDASALWPQVAEGLRFLARYQREDGKIPHEISQAAQHIPWFTDFPYTYYHADTTPWWIVAVWQYWRASGDNALMEELWPSVEKAYRWCLTTETDGDGIIENTSGGLGAIEVGELGEDIHQDIYLAAVWIEALEAVKEMADFKGKASLSRDADRLKAEAMRSLNHAYWRENEGHHAFGILRSGRTNDNLTVWPATAAAFGLLEAPRVESTLKKLASDAISSDWGAHILSAESPLYDPMGYNNGAVWPFVTGFVVWGQYRYRRPWAGFPLLDGLKQMTFHWARGHHPELLSGTFYRPLDTAVPQQFFASSMLVTSCLRGLLGWDPDAPSNRARVSPRIPPHWKRVSVRNLCVGETKVDVELEQDPNTFSAELIGRGPALTFELEIPVPAGAEEFGSEPSVEEGERRVVKFPVTSSPIRVESRWSGGLAVEPPRVNLVPGQRSRGLRILGFHYDGTGWLMELEGVSGRTYSLNLHGEPFSQIEGARLVNPIEGRSTIEIEFPIGPARGVKNVYIRR
jgi:glycogen debranching enzyme